MISQIVNYSLSNALNGVKEIIKLSTLLGSILLTISILSLFLLDVLFIEEGGRSKTGNKEALSASLLVGLAILPSALGYGGSTLPLKSVYILVFMYLYSLLTRHKERGLWDTYSAFLKVICPLLSLLIFPNLHPLDTQYDRMSKADILAYIPSFGHVCARAIFPICLILAIPVYAAFFNAPTQDTQEEEFRHRRLKEVTLGI